MKNIIFLSILLFFVWLVSCQEDELTTVEDVEFNNETPIMTFRDINSIVSQNSKKRLRIKAKTQHRYQNQDEGYPDGIYLEFYDSTGVMTTTLEGDSGFHIALQQSYWVKGNVVVVNLEEQQTLETRVLNWDKKKQEIFTDTLTPVKITTPLEIIKGNGLKAKQDFSEFEITGGVTGIFTVEE